MVVVELVKIVEASTEEMTLSLLYTAVVVVRHCAEHTALYIYLSAELEPNCCERMNEAERRKARCGGEFLRRRNRRI